jgi:uncharacterized membrane protein
MSTRQDILTFAIAIVVVIACTALIMMGYDGDTKVLLGMVVGFYFGRNIVTPSNSDPTK